MIEVNDQDHLERLPDGTIITWLRIPGDETSRAVAFVRAETICVPPKDGRPFDRVVWISPGGWAPMTIDDAGITYPVTVVALGDTPYDWRPAEPHFDVRPELPTFEVPQFGELMTGGTYPRDHALECAARVAAGDAVNDRLAARPEDVLSMADKFVEWLQHEPDRPEPELVDFTRSELTSSMGVDPDQLATTDVELPLSQRLSDAAAALAEANDREPGGPSVSMTINIETLRRYALKLAGEGQ